MSRRRRSSEAVPTAKRFHAPFAKLGKTMRSVSRQVLVSPKERAVPAPKRRQSTVAENDNAIFAEAMEGVVPLPAGDRRRIAQPAPAGTQPPRPVSEEAEALAVLGDLVSGTGLFDLSDTEEYIEGRVVGLDPRVVRRLRRGDFSWQSHLDLHHMTAEEARGSVERFVVAAVRHGQRSVLIIHGRGRNSKDQIPVLKERLKVWLARGSLSRHVLAFASARQCDGGTGALYVLLRRARRRRAPFVVTDGAKR